MQTVDADEATFTIYEVAHWLRCGRAKVAKVAREHGIGMNLRGRAGWRFTAADRVALQKAMAPTPIAPTTARRPRRRRR